jgi:hypothetical protein
MSPTDPLKEQNENLRRELRGLLEPLDIVPLDRLSSRPVDIPRRGSSATAQPPNQELLSLTREGDVLRWQVGMAPAQVAFGGQRATGRAGLLPSEVVHQFVFEQIEPNQVGQVLGALDLKLTPARGLRQLKNGILHDFPDARQAAGKRVLLFIHGTFSTCDNFITELRHKALNGAGQNLLADVEKQYDFVLTFDHPTVGVSPVMNAFDLAALLRPQPKEIAIISHSRGGLVARWFCEALADQAMRRRAVLIASPIGGTSLAAPPRLRSSFDLITNVGEWLRRASDYGAAVAGPFFQVTSVLLRVINSVTRFAANAPLLDAAIAMIPGLAGQSRVGNNEEIKRLRQNTGGGVAGQNQLQYFAIKANFEPKNPGWNFLQYFSKPLQRLANIGGDIVFDGPNDLVVDTEWMTELADNQSIPITDVYDFGTTDRVFHTNYFRQPETVDFIRQKLEIPQG